jgi:hypothetical protein
MVRSMLDVVRFYGGVVFFHKYVRLEGIKGSEVAVNMKPGNLEDRCDIEK